MATAPAPVRGLVKPQRFLEFDLIPSAHGVAVRAKADDLAVLVGRDAVIITRPGGLVLTLAGAPGRAEAGEIRTASPEPKAATGSWTTRAGCVTRRPHRERARPTLSGIAHARPARQAAWRWATAAGQWAGGGGGGRARRARRRGRGWRRPARVDAARHRRLRPAARGRGRRLLASPEDRRPSCGVPRWRRGGAARPSPASATSDIRTPDDLRPCCGCWRRGRPGRQRSGHCRAPARQPGAAGRHGAAGRDGAAAPSRRAAATTGRRLPPTGRLLTGRTGRCRRAMLHNALALSRALIRGRAGAGPVRDLVDDLARRRHQARPIRPPLCRTGQWHEPDDRPG